MPPRLVVLSLLLATACRAPSPGPPLRFAGCRGVDADGRCLVGPDARLIIAWDGVPAPIVATPGEVRPDGTIVVRPPPGLERVVLRAGPHEAQLRLGAEPPNSTLDAVAAAPPGEARRRLTGALATVPPEERAPLLLQLARLENRSGERAAAMDHLEEAASGARIDGVLRARLLLAYIATFARDFDRARRAIDAVPPGIGGWAEGEALRAYHLAVLLRQTGELRAAETALRAAMADATRFELAFAGSIVAEHAALLQQMGRPEAALALLSARAPPGEVPCSDAALLGNLAWAQLLARERGRPVGDPADALARLRALEEPCGLPPGFRLTTRLNQSLEAIGRGEVDGAERSLAEAAAWPDDVESGRWRLDIEARLLRARGRLDEAQEKYERLRILARSAGEPDVLWRAATGLGATHAAAGRPEAAIAAWREAEDALDGALARIPVDESRQRFLGDGEESARSLVDALVAAGRAGEAADVARRARRRALDAAQVRERLSGLDPETRGRWLAARSQWLAEREALDADRAEDWKRSADALAAQASARAERLAHLEAQGAALVDALGPPVASLEAGAPASAPNEPPDLAEVTYFPGRLGFHALVRRGDATTAIALGPLPQNEVGAWAVRGVAPSLVGARRLRLLTHGALRDLDLHAALLDGAPLVSRFQVHFGLDVPARQAAPSRGAAQVVADPRGDLAATVEEATVTEARMRALGWQVEPRLEGRTAAPGAVRAALGQVDWLHFAGHAEWAGEEGFESALLLADGSRLTVGDLLLLPRVPGVVVLSACESGRTHVAPLAGAEGLGLAQALVLGGARAVVAATRPVEDRTARRLMSAFYAALDAGADVEAALTTAQRGLATEPGAGDWAAFRIFEP